MLRLKPDTSASIDIVLDPAPAEVFPVELSNTEPNRESVLYSNQYAVSDLFGLTVPRSVAVEVLTSEAVLVVAEGAVAAGGPAVLKLRMVPLTVPNWFWALMRK